MSETDPSATGQAPSYQAPMSPTTRRRLPRLFLVLPVVWTVLTLLTFLWHTGHVEGTIADFAALVSGAGSGRGARGPEGGRGASIPTEFEAIAVAHEREELVAHGTVWFMGLLLLAAAGWQAHRRNAERERADRALTAGDARIQATVEELRERNRYIETILENAPIGFAVNTVHDSHGFFVSGKFEEIYGVARGSLTGVDDFFEKVYRDPEFREQMKARVMADMASGDPARMKWEDIPLTSASGERRYVTAINIPLLDQGMMVSTVQDVTAHHLAEEARQTSEARFRAVVEQAGDGFELVDAKGRFIDVNGATCRQLGYSKEELLTLSVADIDPTVTPEQFALRFHSMVGSPPVTFESTHRRKDGTLLPVEVAASVLRDGETLLGVSFARDISERRQAQAEQQRLQEQLIQVQKLEAVGRLAGGVAHDFNNILTAMMMHLGLLQGHPSVESEVASGLADLEAEANRAADLTRQLLMFSRRHLLQTKVFDLNVLLANLLRMLRRLIGETIVLEFAGAARDLWIDADPGMIEQVVTNLVVNARDAMPGGGRVTLVARSVEFDASAPEGDPEARAGRFACLEVADTGEGMDEATVGRIFEPFFTTKEMGKGTGLGLATVHGIVKQHKGWVRVASARGRGTTFQVYLPASAAPSASDQGARGARTLPRGSETLLVVEDAEPVRRATASILRQLGYRVLEAGDSREALEIWSRERDSIALLLTDMVMPGAVSGQQLAEQLRREKPSLKCLLVSGYSRELVQRGVPTESEIAFLAKPFEPAALAAAVRACLAGQGA